MPSLEELYLESLSDKEKVVLQLAIKHLGSSFDIKKSIGYQEWTKKFK